jgi:hypothetical protein
MARRHPLRLYDKLTLETYTKSGSRSALNGASTCFRAGRGSDDRAKREVDVAGFKQNGIAWPTCSRRPRAKRSPRPRGRYWNTTRSRWRRTRSGCRIASNSPAVPTNGEIVKDIILARRAEVGIDDLEHGKIVKTMLGT